MTSPAHEGDMPEHSYRKKPVVIQAFCLNGGPMPDWFLDARSADTVRTFSENTGNPFNDPLTHAEIKTLEGVMREDRGDWIIRGIKGEMYPCKPDIFAATYEQAALSHSRALAADQPGDAVAYLLTRPSGFAWAAMPHEFTPETREAHAQDGVQIEALGRIAAPSRAEPIGCTTQGVANLLALVIKTEDFLYRQIGSKPTAQELRAAILAASRAAGKGER